MARLNQLWREAGEAVRDGYVKQIAEAEEKLKQLKAHQSLLKEQALGRLKGGDVQTEGLGSDLTPLMLSDTSIEALQESINEKLAGLKINPIEVEVSADVSAKDMAAQWSAAAAAITSVGAAMSSIEDPAAKVMGTIAQAIATIALGYSQATLQAASTGPWGWIAFAAAGLATMISSISAIHSATGYANGGIVTGNSYSGDNIMANVGATPIGLNAGELVLNKSQQAQLASELENEDRGIHIAGVIEGENIVLVANRSLRRQGKGELVTWKD